MSSIQAGVLAANAIVYSTDTTGNLVFKTGSSGNTALTLDTNQLAIFSNGVSVTGNVSSNSVVMGGVIASPYTGFKNRIINGNMIIDQRNAGAAAVTVNSSTATYALDRWRGFGQSSAGVFTIRQSTVAPSGFINSINVTVSTANTTIPAAGFYTLQQAIEGNNISDLGWGSSSARNITLSFQANSSVTGTHSGSIKNNDGTRSYPFSYSIASANTWTPVSITVPGDTTGTWLTNTSIGLTLTFNLGSGRTATANTWAAGNYDGATSSANVISTAGATFFVTGVQVEAGNTATSFDYRSYGTELSLCHRYYYKVVTSAAAAEVLAPSGWCESTTQAYCYTTFPVMLRVAPTALEQTGTAANYVVRYVLTSGTCSAVPTFNNGSIWGARTIFTVASGLTAGQAVAGQTAATAGVYLAWSAEL